MKKLQEICKLVFAPFLEALPGAGFGEPGKGDDGPQ